LILVHTLHLAWEKELKYIYFMNLEIEALNFKQLPLLKS